MAKIVYNQKNKLDYYYIKYNPYPDIISIKV